MINNKIKVDHIGIVVKNITEAAEQLVKEYNFEKETDIIFVPSQKIRCIYVQNNEGIKIQLIEPTTEESPVSIALKKGGGLHHICYECSNLVEKISNMRAKGALIVTKPFIGEGVGGRKAAFILDQTMGLVEFVERK